jgi:membrane protein
VTWGVYAFSVLGRAVRRYLHDGGSMYAAALAYYGVFSLFPLLVVLVALFGLIVRDQALQERAIQLIVERLPEAVRFRSEIEQVVLGVSRSNNGLIGFVGFAGTIWTASEMFGALRRALNAAFRATPNPDIVRAKLTEIYCVFVTVALILFGVAANRGLEIMKEWGEPTPAEPYLDFAAWVGNRAIPFLVLYGVLLVVFRLLPDATVGLADLWPGALVSTVGFEAVRLGFGIYFDNFAWYRGAYGTIGGILAFLFFVFLLANIIIFAAIVTAVVLRDDERKRERADEVPTHC